MSLAFIRIAHQVARHPKFMRASSAAKWLWVVGIIYSQEIESDGFIPRVALRALGYFEDDVEQATESLVQAGLWMPVDDGWMIHDYLDYNYSAAQIAKIRRANRINGAKGGRAKSTRYSGAASDTLNDTASGGLKPIRSESIRVDSSKRRKNAAAPLTHPVENSRKESPNVGVLAAMILEEVLPLGLEHSDQAEAAKCYAAKFHLSYDSRSIANALASAQAQAAKRGDS